MVRVFFELAEWLKLLVFQFFFFFFQCKNVFSFRQNNLLGMRPVTKDYKASSEFDYNNIKYLHAVKPSIDKIESNEMFFKEILCNIPKDRGIIKINNLPNLQKTKEIPDNSIWNSFRYSLDKKNSTNDYLKIPQPAFGQQIKWSEIKNNPLLRTGIANPNDPNQQYVKNVQDLLRTIKEDSSTPSGTNLLNLLQNYINYLENGGEQMYLLKQDGWSFEDINANKFNLSQIPQNYGVTSIIRKEFFPIENSNDNYHQGITGVQNIIGSPFMSANLHTEHANTYFATGSVVGTKLWMFFKELKQGILSEYFAKQLKYLECCKEVQQFEKQFWWDLESLVLNNQVQVEWTIQFPGQTICGRDGIWHQVLHLEFTQAISIDYAPDTIECWKNVK